jgi:hypothetical protein
MEAKSGLKIIQIKVQHLASQYQQVELDDLLLYFILICFFHLSTNLLFFRFPYFAAPKNL